MKAEKFYTGIFGRLPEIKQKKIIDIAVNEFAEKGFLNSRIKEIAKKAEISYGSMYSYFPTKDDLLRTIMIQNIKLQKELFNKTFNEDADIFINIKNLFLITMKMGEENPELIAIWKDIAQSYHSKFLPEILELEKEGLNNIQNLIKNEIDKGYLSADINSNAAAYIIDSTNSELLASYISDQNKKKKSMFFGHKTNSEIVDELMIIVRKILPLEV